MGLLGMRPRPGGGRIRLSIPEGPGKFPLENFRIGDVLNPNCGSNCLDVMKCKVQKGRLIFTDF